MSSIAIESVRNYRHRYVGVRISFRSVFLVVCFLTIAIISAMDIWFAVMNSSIMVYEKNPICMELIKLDPENFTYFIFCKASGTVAVLAILLLLRRSKYRHADAVIWAITLFQIGLLMYLTLSDPLTYNLPNFALLFQETPESIWLLTE